MSISGPDGYLKGDLLYFQVFNPSDPLTNIFKHLRIRPRFRRDFRIFFYSVVKFELLYEYLHELEAKFENGLTCQ